MLCCPAPELDYAECPFGEPTCTGACLLLATADDPAERNA